jgi:uncharacterized protein (DUF433 family)
MNDMELTETTTQYFDFVSEDSIRIKGHRLGIEHILAYYQEGFTPEQIAKEFPGLSLELVYGTITFYLANKAEINAYLHRRLVAYEQVYQDWAKNPSPLVERLRAIRDQHPEIA